jgi:hypothetical protein
MKESRKKDLPLVKMSQTLLTTRRLLYWSYQIGKRQTPISLGNLDKETKIDYRHLQKNLPFKNMCTSFPSMLKY